MSKVIKVHYFNTDITITRDDRLELNWTEYIGNSFSYVLVDLDVSLYAENLRTVHNRL